MHLFDVFSIKIVIYDMNRELILGALYQIRSMQMVANETYAI